jgi:steroid delta-isomerase-like uncharacterized protein
MKGVPVPELTDLERRNLAAVSDVMPFWNTHDIPGVLSYYDDEIEWRNVALGETYRGKAEVGAFLERLMTAFPNLTFQVTRNFARDNLVAEQWVMKGTHLGTFMGVPPTAREIVIPGMSMVELRDGKFLSDHFYFDATGVLRQMGIFPPLAIGETIPGRLALWGMVNRTKLLVGGAIVAIAIALRSRR